MAMHPGLRMPIAISCLVNPLSTSIFKQFFVYSQAGVSRWLIAAAAPAVIDPVFVEIAFLTLVQADLELILAGTNRRENKQVFFIFLSHLWYWNSL